MSNVLTVASRAGNYDVIFIEDFFEVLKNQYKKDTFFIIDEKLIELYEDPFASILNKEYYILVEANEQHKTLDYCQHLIQSLVGKNIRKVLSLLSYSAESGGNSFQPPYSLKPTAVSAVKPQ
jgi:3-dehydroquinate synthetase